MEKTRDDLIDEVRYGRCSPEQAEAEAKRCGFEPFARTPDATKFDPTKEEWWTLVMTLAWIAKRHNQSVREVFDPYRAECFDWHFREWRVGPDGPIHKGWFLEQRNPATIARFLLGRIYDETGPNELNVRDAEAQLKGALKVGQLTATGKTSDFTRRAEIPCYEWNDLVLVEETGRDVARDGSQSTTGYDDLLLRRRAVIGLWPERLPASLLAFATTIAPEGAGYFALYCAAHWIATAGGTRTFDPADVSIWRAAYADLIARISSGQVSVTGIRGGIREKIDGHLFASIRIDYPYQDPPLDLLFEEELYLCSYPYVDEEHWSKGFDDSLCNREGVRWSKLMVVKSEVAQHWPFSTSPVATGAPGRPTSMHVVAAEHERRLASGESERGVGVEAVRLLEWFGRSHPSHPPLTVKTIENNIRKKHRDAAKPRK